MRVTERQGWILQHLGEIIYRRKGTGMRGYFLEKQDCTAVVNTLINKGLVRANGGPTQLERTELAPHAS